MTNFKEISPGDQIAYLRGVAAVPSGMIERVLADEDAARLVGRLYDSRAGEATSSAQRALEVHLQQMRSGIRNAPGNLYDVEELGL